MLFFTIPADAILVSTDVTSLYTNIPQEEGFTTYAPHSSQVSQGNACLMTLLRAGKQISSHYQIYGWRERERNKKKTKKGEKALGIVLPSPPRSFQCARLFYCLLICSDVLLFTATFFFFIYTNYF